jgi:acetyl-CoA acyltransferase
MREVAIVAGARTPFGRGVKGLLKDTRPDTLGAHAIVEMMKKVGDKVKGSEIEDIVMGCAIPEAEQGLNIARQVGFLAGLPSEVPAMTVNRFCSSGLQSINIVATRIAAGEIDIAIAGGVESMSMVPMTGGKVAVHPKLAAEYPQAFTPMGVTAEIVAKRFGVSRKDQDEFAALSHARAAAAWKAGKYEGEVAPITTIVYEGGQGREVTVSMDECIRADTTAEKLGLLKPAFDPTGSVTAGNASPITDGAATVLVMARDVAEKRGLKVLGYLRSFACVGVDPDIMGIGPVPAIKKLLSKAGKTINDIDLFEINEAFAAQAVYCARALEIPSEKLNVNGGAIAIGHPLGATGGRQAIHILGELARRGKRFGVSGMCVGGGMGAAALWEVA